MNYEFWVNYFKQIPTTSCKLLKGHAACQKRHKMDVALEFEVVSPYKGLK